MSRTDIIEKLNEIFRDVFDADSIEVNEAMTADDVENWDSLTHIILIAEVEDVFDIKFEMKDVIGMKNVGEMIDVIEKEAR